MQTPDSSSQASSSQSFHPGHSFRLTELNSIFGLIECLVPAIAVEKLDDNAHAFLRSLNPALISRVPSLRQAVTHFQSLTCCDICKQAYSMLSLSCGHSVCRTCFYNLLHTCTDGYVIYHKFEKRRRKPLACSLCQTQVSTKTLGKGLQNLTEFEDAAELREAKILEECQDCRNPNEPSQHSCLCKRCSVVALLKGSTQCQYCGEALGSQDQQLEELVADPQFTVVCSVCNLSIPMQYILRKCCCPGLLCSVCQSLKSSSQCATCNTPLDPKARDQLSALQRELEVLVEFNPALFS